MFEICGCQFGECDDSYLFTHIICPHYAPPDRTVRTVEWFSCFGIATLVLPEPCPLTLCPASSSRIGGAPSFWFYFSFRLRSKLQTLPRFREPRSEEHTSELQSHSFISYAVFCLKKKK